MFSPPLLPRPPLPLSLPLQSCLVKGMKLSQSQATLWAPHPAHALWDYRQNPSLSAPCANQEPWWPGRGVHDRVSSPQPGASCPPTTDLSVPGPRDPLGISVGKSHGPSMPTRVRAVGPLRQALFWAQWGWEPDPSAAGFFWELTLPPGEI